MSPERSREEVANAATHAVGIVASLIGGVVLIVLAVVRGSTWDIVGVSVFASSLVLLYVASTIYHTAQLEAARRRLQLFDHCAIYVLIAGTYTPFMLGSLRGAWGWSLFGVIWGLAVAGVLFKLLFLGRFPRLSTGIYLAMGWLVVIAAGPLVRALDASILAWLVAGGVAYTAGTAFYHSRRVPFAHAVWHMFVLCGSVCHGIAVGLQLWTASSL